MNLNIKMTEKRRKELTNIILEANKKTAKIYTGDNEMHGNLSILDEIRKTRDNLDLLPISEYGGKEFTLLFLSLAVAIPIALTVVALPGLAYVYTLFEANTPKEKERVRQAVKRYKRRGLIEMKDGRILVTADGNRLLDTYKARSLFFKIPDKWDGKWRMIMFDIPGKYENERKIVREKLLEIGAKEYQQSVFIFPYDCVELITTLKWSLRIEKHIMYLEVARFTDSEKFRKLFKLK